MKMNNQLEATSCCRAGLSVGQRESCEVTLAVYRYDRAVIAHRNIGCRGNSGDQVGRHRLGESASPHDQHDFLGELGQIQRGLTC